MSTATDVLTDRLTEAEHARDAALAQLADAVELLDEHRDAVRAVQQHADDLVWLGELRGQLDALGIEPGELTERVERLSGGPVGKLLGLGQNGAGSRATLVS